LLEKCLSDKHLRGGLGTFLGGPGLIFSHRVESLWRRLCAMAAVPVCRRRECGAVPAWVAVH
jgi:hypothetical protein